MQQNKYKGHFLFGIVFLILSNVNIQAQEAEAPIIYNLELMDSPMGMLKSNVSNSIDSTFVYSTDTLSLPFFDEFSKNKIQTYEASPTDPGVTSEVFYSLLDENDDAFPMGVAFTRVQTFRKIFNVNTGASSTQNFPATIVKYSDLSRYPVTYETVNAYPAYYIYDTVGIVNSPDTIHLSVPDLTQKKATQFFKKISEPNTLWLDDNAYHNYRFAIDPWSLGVMTFDGLDNKGYPYAIGTTTRGYADYLTTKPIDLSNNSLADSLYLSFLYQFEGFGDEPEDNDSLVVQFLNTQTGRWGNVWSKPGRRGDGKFYLAHIPIKNTAYLGNNFQFRVVNYGDLSGALDHFHIDYVHLRAYSGKQDTLIEDFAMVYPTKSLLERYSSVPWDHYRNNPLGKMNTKMEIVVRNSYLNGGANITSANGAKVNVFHNNVAEGNFAINGQAMVGYDPPTQPVPDYAPRTTYTSYHPINGYQFDPNKPGTHQRFEVVTVANVPVGSNFTANDTSVVYQDFRNYYAYDDGSAEKAYGTHGSQSRVAVQFEPYEADTIIGVMINFVPTVKVVTNYLFQVFIWKDNNGKPGEVIYEDNSFNLRQPSYGYGRNAFVEYWTEVPVFVTGKFHIGWKQLDAPILGVGLDKNNDQSQYTSFSIDNGSTWTASEISGSLMVRPIFSTSMNDEMSVPVIEKQSYIAYPNPTFDKVTIKGEFTGVEQFVLRDLTGREIQRTTEPTMDLTNEPIGIYFIQVEGAYANTIKVVKR